MDRTFLDSLKKKKIKVYGISKKKTNTWRINDIKKNIFFLNLENKKELKKIIKKIKPKTIYHFAAYGGSSNQKNFSKIKNSILIGTKNLIEECKKNNFSLFVNTGSSSEYGFKSSSMKESDILEPNSVYALFKCFSTLLSVYYSKVEKLPIVCIRPFHVYGPYESNKRLIPNLIRSFLKNKKISLVDPEISRDLIYIDDFINFYISLSSKKKIFGKVFNLGFGKKITIRMIYNELKKISKSKIKLKWSSMQNRSWDQKVWYANMSKVKKNLNWKARIDYKKGLRKCFFWYKKKMKKTDFKKLNYLANFLRKKIIEISYKKNSPCWFMPVIC